MLIQKTQWVKFRRLLVCFATFLFLILICFPASAATKTVECGLYTVSLSNAIQKKYEVRFTPYASTQHCYFYEKSTFNSQRNVVFDIVFTVNVVTPINNDLLYYGLIVSKELNKGRTFFYIRYNPDAGNASEVKKDIIAVFKQLKFKPSWKLIRANKNIANWKRNLISFLNNGQLSDGSKIDLNDYDKYKFILLNNDSKYELVMAPISTKTWLGYAVIGHYGNKIYHGGSDNILNWSSKVYYISKKNKMLFKYTKSSGSDSWNRYYIGKLNKGKLDLVQWGTSSKTNGNKSYAWSTTSYQYDLKFVTKKQFNKYLKQAYNSSQSKRISGYMTRQQAIVYLYFGKNIYGYEY